MSVRHRVESLTSVGVVYAGTVARNHDALLFTSVDTTLENGKIGRKKNVMLVAYAFKRVASGAHLSTRFLLKPAKRSDNKADYCLDCSSLP